MGNWFSFCVWSVNVFFCIFCFPCVALLSIYFQPQYMMECISSYTKSQNSSMKDILWFGKTVEPIVALTIDDAPSESTSAILHVLRQHNVKATFFIISEYAERFPHLMKEILADGHAIANHFTEDKACVKYSIQEFESKLIECDKVLTKFRSESNIAEESIKWARPGSGWFNKSMCEVANRFNYRFCMGNVYPHDAQLKFEWLNSFFLCHRTRPGSIIIVHDRPWTVGVLRRCLPRLKQTFNFVGLHRIQSCNKKE